MKHRATWAHLLGLVFRGDLIQAVVSFECSVSFHLWSQNVALFSMSGEMRSFCTSAANIPGSVSTSPVPFSTFSASPVGFGLGWDQVGFKARLGQVWGWVSGWLRFGLELGYAVVAF